MRTMMCLRFRDGWTVSYINGSAMNHVALSPGMFVVFQNGLLSESGKHVFKQLKLTYSRWKNIVNSKNKRRKKNAKCKG